jgi:dephospho-CoA kinase
MTRSKMERADAESRIRSQLPQEDYIKLADVVIENHGDLKTLKRKVSGMLNNS